MDRQLLEKNTFVHNLCPQSNCRKSFIFSRALRWLSYFSLLVTATLILDWYIPFPSRLSLASSLGFHSASFWPPFFSKGEACVPPSPNLFAYHPPRLNNDEIVKASNNIHKYLSQRVSKSDIDSIAISIVTPNGPIFEQGYGILRANETAEDQKYPVDSNSIYRIASISKMFTVLETLILRERGALNWDDLAEKYLPDLSIPSYGWASYLDGMQAQEEDEKPRITLRQLASHLAGIGRDYPPGDIQDWPVLEPGSNFLGLPNFPEHSYEAVMKSLSQYPLVNLPYLYPIYSNTGIDILGLANVAANKLSSATPLLEPRTHKELVQRDIFNPLQMNSSFFRVPSSQELREHMALPAIDTDWANLVLGDVDDAAGGQYSSLGDLAKAMKTFLSPSAKGGVVPARVLREWLRPLHIWGSGTQHVGAPWEVFSIDGYEAYTKGGNLPGYHSEFAIIPEYSVGLIVLVTGTYADTRTILTESVKRFLPTMKKLHEVEVRRRYVGTWVNGEDIAEVALMNKGALFLKKLIVRGVDVLRTAQDAGDGLAGKPGKPVALWSTGRVGEFRLAFGRKELNNVKDAGCLPYWVSIDPGANSRGSPLDLVYWKNGVLAYPSAGVNFARKS